jgi:hypothetical protein
MTHVTGYGSIRIARKAKGWWSFGVGSSKRGDAGDERAKRRSRLSTWAVQSTLARMKWRRGLLLAGVNLAIATPGVVLDSREFWQYTGDDTARSQISRVEYVVFQENVPVSLDPCNWFDIGHSRLIEVGGFANLPTTLITGWHDPCLTKTPLGRLVRRVVGARNHPVEVVDCVCLAALLCIQWLLVGGIPLVRPNRWWLEPGAFITACATIAGALAIIPITYSFARIPELFAGLAWLWYFGLLLWKPVHLAWQSTLHGFRRLS